MNIEKRTYGHADSHRYVSRPGEEESELATVVEVGFYRQQAAARTQQPQQRAIKVIKAPRFLNRMPENTSPKNPLRTDSLNSSSCSFVFAPSHAENAAALPPS